MITKAASPLFTVELPYATATLSARSNPDSRRWETRCVAAGARDRVRFAGYSGLNRLTRHRLNKPAVSLAATRLDRGS